MDNVGVWSPSLSPTMNGFLCVGPSGLVSKRTSVGRRVRFWKRGLGVTLHHRWVPVGTPPLPPSGGTSKSKYRKVLTYFLLEYGRMIP